MAYKDVITPATGFGDAVSTLEKPLGKIGKFLTSVLMSVEKAGAANARYHRIVALHNKSDDELAKMGLKRDDIVRHVFGDLYYA